MPTPYTIARRLTGERTRTRQAREWAERRLAVKSWRAKWLIEVLFEKHQCGWSVRDISNHLDGLSDALGRARGWPPWHVYAILDVAGRIPHELWDEAEWDNRQFDARLEREAWDRAEARRKEEIRIARGHEALGRAGRRLDRAVVRFLRRQAQGVGRWSERLRETKVAARRRTLMPDQVAAEIAKAARARAALRERGDRFLRDVGPLVIAMRRHRLSFTDVARHLEREGVATAKGGRWTAAAARSVVDRLRSREGDPTLTLTVVDWWPPPPPAPPPQPIIAAPMPPSIEPEPIAPSIVVPVVVVAPKALPPAPPRAPAGPGSREAARLAREVRDRVWPFVRSLRNEGLSLVAITRRMNDVEMVTRMGRPWCKAAVSVLVNRMEREDAERCTAPVTPT